uniref:Abhydrolase domain containing 2, acylglycerol lipase b n=1 Tax=Esox lucius TaxID=8010 RepID=A0A6Q2WRZ1_ESOLU
MAASVEPDDVHTITPEMPAMFDGMKLAALATVLYFLGCLNLKSPKAPPDVNYQDTPLNRYLIKSCPILTKEYVPPLLWGKSGHLQTALYGKLGRVRSLTPSGLRKYLPMQDRATATFDLFEPLGDHHTGGESFPDVKISLKHYIHTFMDHTQRQGYRCAVLNHLGALPNIELTSPRMFTYGKIPAMAGYIKWAFPQTLLIVVGFSLGGKIVCKFLGENRTNQDIIVILVSPLSPYVRDWNILGSLLGLDSSMMKGADLSRLYAFHGQNTLKGYKKERCPHYIYNVSEQTRATVPLLVYASDDPLVHQSLLTVPRTFKQNVIFALTLHGGHLGFFEGAVLFPQPLTWTDKVIVGYANTMCQWERHDLPYTHIHKQREF